MDRLGLLLGKDYNKIGNLLIRHPTLEDIREYGGTDDVESKYMNSVHFITSMLDLESMAHILLVEHNLWYKDLDPWLFFIELYHNEQNLKDILEWWTGRKFGVIFQDDGKPPYLYDKTDGLIINQPILLMIINFIKEINYIPLVDKSRPNFGKREKTAMRYYRSKYSKLKNKKLPSDTDFSSIISSIACKMQCSPDDLLHYKVYQIWDRYHRLIQIDTYDKTMLGYYTGNIKKKDINFNSINWSKIIIVDKTTSAESGNTTFKVSA